MLCEIDSNLLTTVVPTVESNTDYLDLKSLLANLDADYAGPVSNLRTARLERRLEQLSNVVMNNNRQQAESVNITAIQNDIRDLKEKQNSIIESVEDLKKLMIAMYKSIRHDE